MPHRADAGFLIRKNEKGLPGASPAGYESCVLGRPPMAGFQVPPARIPACNSVQCATAVAVILALLATTNV